MNGCYIPPRLLRAVPRDGRRVWIEYEDGVSVEVDIWPLISWGPVFERLREDDGYFQQLWIDRRTLCWPDNVDLAPFRVYDLAKETLLTELLKVPA